MEADNKRKNTINRIMESAIVEFLDKGYAKSSLRTICKNANVTTGAFYFSFESKEALLDHILAPLIQQYEDLIIQFRKLEIDHPDKSIEIDKRLMRFLLQYKREAIIVLEKCDGSKYENYREHVLNMMMESFRQYFTNALNLTPDMNLIKILASERLQGCIDIIKGEYDMEYAMLLVEQTGIYAYGGIEMLTIELQKDR